MAPRPLLRLAMMVPAEGGEGAITALLVRDLMPAARRPLPEASSAGIDAA